MNFSAGLVCTSVVLTNTDNNDRDNNEKTVPQALNSYWLLPFVIQLIFQLKLCIQFALKFHCKFPPSRTKPFSPENWTQLGSVVFLKQCTDNTENDWKEMWSRGMLLHCPMDFRINVELRSLSLLFQFSMSDLPLDLQKWPLHTLKLYLRRQVHGL